MERNGQRRILHLHSTFALGGKEARAVDLMNAFGSAFRHDIVSGMPDQTGAAELIDPQISFQLMPTGFPDLVGRPRIGRFRTLANAMRGYDLVLTYNWGAMDAVMARRLFGGPPLIHHEDGFNEDEAHGQKWQRILYRRLALPAAARLIVPSRHLEGIALGIWRQPRARVVYVPNGVDPTRYAAPDPDAIPGLARRPGEVVIGTMAGLRAVKNLPCLVRAFAGAARAMPHIPTRLVIVGQGPEEGAIQTEAERQGVRDRLIMPGFLPHPHRYVGAFDIFALSSNSEQFPISLVEAMAAGLPAVSTRVGDVVAIVAAENLPFLADVGDEAALTRALARLIGNPALRAQVGSVNRARVASEFTRDAVIAAYRSLYEAAMTGG